MNRGAGISVPASGFVNSHKRKEDMKMMYFPERTLFHVELLDEWNHVMYQYTRPYKSGNAAYATACRIAKTNYPNYKMIVIRQM